MTTHGPVHQQEHMSNEAAFVLPLAVIDRTQLSIAGGKAANLGELIQAGFAVPAGFCVTTAAYERVAARAGLDTYLTGIESSARSDSACQIELAAAIRTALN